MSKAPNSLAEHTAIVAERRGGLRRACAGILSADTTFVWEIGCGHGHFLAAFGAAHPRRVCVGVDLLRDRVARAERKRERAGLGNVHFIRADAADFLAALPAEARFSAIYILFPDPWPKRRHHKHRLLDPDFLSEVSARAEEGTRLYFRTDHAPYFEAARAALAGHPRWRLADERWPFEAPTVFQERAAGHQSLVAVRRPLES